MEPFLNPRQGGRRLEAFIDYEPKQKGNSEEIVRRGRRRMISPNAKTVKAQSAISKLLWIQAPDTPLTGAVFVGAIFVLSIPTSWPIWKREAAAAGILFPYAEGKAPGPIPDRGNLLKMIEDCLEKGGWLNNDSQIVAGPVIKRYGKQSGYHVVAYELDEVRTREDWIRRRASL